tara:strand:- start:76516 stop:77085 length:570 start_codon:yes stop_codon:yes gene_type:complete
MKQAKIAMEILIILIVVVFTTALILALVNSGVIKVKQGEEINFLNTDYIPLHHASSFSVSDFEFCYYVENFICEPADEFVFGDDINFLMTIDSSVIDNNVIITENYNVIDPNGQIIFSAEERGDYTFEYPSNQKVASFPFTDYLAIDYGPAGEYTLEILLTNILLNKEIKLEKKFTLTEEIYIYDEEEG